MLLNARLSNVTEEKGLIAEEQGGSRKQKECREQVLSLVLLGKKEMVKKEGGMLVAFIDFTKAFDKVDREKSWGCLEQLGVNGKFLQFVKTLYLGSSCRLKVDDKVSEQFGVNIGLWQGCVLSPLLFPCISMVW